VRNPKYLKQPRFKVKLARFHKESGKSAYQVAKDTGLNYGTVSAWTKEDREVTLLPDHIIKLIAYYGLDWTDPAVIEIIEASEPPDQDNTPGQVKTLVAGGY